MLGAGGEEDLTEQVLGKVCVKGWVGALVHWGGWGGGFGAAGAAGQDMCEGLGRGAGALGQVGSWVRGSGCCGARWAHRAGPDARLQQRPLLSVCGAPLLLHGHPCGRTTPRAWEQSRGCSTALA